MFYSLLCQAIEARKNKIMLDSQAWRVHDRYNLAPITDLFDCI
jgi:hypothetical protein